MKKMKRSTSPHTHLLVRAFTLATIGTGQANGMGFTTGQLKAIMAQHADSLMAKARRSRSARNRKELRAHAARLRRIVK